jgi:hypothetical protein
VTGLRGIPFEEVKMRRQFGASFDACTSKIQFERRARVPGVGRLSQKRHQRR